MSSDRQLSEEDRIAKVLETHFPGCRIWEGEKFFFTPAMLLAGDLHPLRREDDFEDLRRFARATTELWNAYSKLSLQTKKAMRMGEPARPEHVVDPFRRVRANLLNELVALHRAVHGRNPDRYRDARGATEDIGMVETAKSNLEDLASITKRGVTAARPQKAQLVAVARSAWKRYTNNTPPKVNDASPFIDFLADVIELAGKQDEDGWKPETVMRVWNEYESS